MLLRCGPASRVRRPGILTEDSIARTVRVYCARTGRGGITDDGGNLAVAVHFDCAISSGFLNFRGDIGIVSAHFVGCLQPFICAEDARQQTLGAQPSSAPETRTPHRTRAGERLGWWRPS